MKIQNIVGSILLYALLNNAYADIPLFNQKIQLADHHSLIQVAEGEGEPRSIGSYAIRLYGGANPSFPMDDFLSGQIRPRDGSVERVVLADLNRDGRDEIVVIIRAAGSGGYLSADAFSWQNKKLKLTQSINGLDAKIDPIRKLKEQARKK